jgi:hypothetical protein
MSFDFDRLNPYSSPAVPDPAEQPPMSRQEALRRLRWPAIGIIVFTIFNLLPLRNMLPAIQVIAASDSMTPEERLQVTIHLGTVSIGIVLALVALVSSVQILRGRTQGWAWAAAVCSLVPCLTIWGWVSFGFALWLIVLLCRRDIRKSLAKKHLVR